MSKTLTVSLPSDSTDFLSMVCPHCAAEFKTRVVDGDIRLKFCPFCRHAGSSWLTPAQAAYLEATAVHHAAAMVHEKLDGALKRMARLPNVTVRRSGGSSSKPRAPVERDDQFPILWKSACCGTDVRSDPDSGPTFCGGCGERLSAEREPE